MQMSTLFKNHFKKLWLLTYLLTLEVLAFVKVETQSDVLRTNTQAYNVKRDV